jgi:hypothetical protein
MMTMLYEKTLNRKIIGAKQTDAEKPDETETHNDTNGQANGNENGLGRISTHGTKDGRGFIQVHFQNLKSLVQSMFARKPKLDSRADGQAASMGKILNLMR